MKNFSLIETYRFCEELKKEIRKCADLENYSDDINEVIQSSTRILNIQQHLKNIQSLF